MVVIDIWGGERNQEHLARMLRPIPEALKITQSELLDGFLVNLRREVAWGSFEEFDARK